MKHLTGAQIRRMWLDFFASKGHVIEPGASLIPHNDPSLLWINAGVAALKKYFDGSEKPACPRITNAQKSLRTNDIENVGLTARHHTFFEMLGNFSIGDYFRTEAVTWGFELLTSPKWFDFELDKLYFTVHPTDDVTRKLWMSLGVPADHLIDCEGNFWEIGEGPCGPNTEIFYDRGTKYDPENIGIDLLKKDMENDRYIEIWNIVFSQYNAKEGLKRSEYPELPQKNIDTGAGLERLACVMQEVETNFETDLFMPIIREIEKLATVKYSKETRLPYHAIADHIRTCTFAIADGAMFSNEGRGYVLRRILRRAVRFAKKIGIKESFMYKLVYVVRDIMLDYYPYLNENLDTVSKLIRLEEEKFAKTLNAGEQILNQYLEECDGKLTGAEVFKLYDTYGFPIELTKEIAAEKNVTIDEVGFKEEMKKQKEMSRNARDVDANMHKQAKDLLDFEDASNYTYDPTPITSKVIALFKDGERIERLTGKGEIAFDNTNFYAESGGQVADAGYIEINGKQYKVLDVQKAPHKQHLHTVDLGEDYVDLGSEAKLVVDLEFRTRITRNHSSVHLLQKALQEVVGSHIKQAGSYVDDKRLRFDFTHFEKISEEDLKKVERKVNEVIASSIPSDIKWMSIDDAKKTGAMALFDEKYGDRVRVVNFGGWSIELCAGCHVANTKEIGCFVIESEESISSGVRRIIARTGLEAYDYMKGIEAELVKSSKMLGCLSMFDNNTRLEALLKQVEELKKEIKDLKGKESLSLGKDLVAESTCEDKIVVIKKLQGIDKDALMAAIDYVKSLNKPYFIYLVNENSERSSLLCTASKDFGFNCGQIIKETSKMLNGSGGGRPDMAQGGAKDLSNLDKVFNYLKDLL